MPLPDTVKRLYIGELHAVGRVGLGTMSSIGDPITACESGDQCDQIWQNFGTRYFVIFFASWQIFIAANGKILQNNLDIWSHWWR